MKRILEPCVGNKVFIKKGNKYKEVEIIEGAFFRNNRVSNFWKWKEIDTGYVREGYGEFYIKNNFSIFENEKLFGASFVQQKPFSKIFLIFSHNTPPPLNAA